MSVQQVLNEDWSDYDNRKIRGGSDHRDFACSEDWEVDYLIDKIVKTHPYLSRPQVKAAITSCCNIVRAPHPRQKFVECVMGKLI